MAPPLNPTHPASSHPASSHDAASAARTQSSHDHQAAADHDACLPLSLFPLSPPAPASLSLPLSQAPSASAHTDAVAQPSPCPNHTQNTASSKTPKNICKGGPGPGPTFLLPLVLPVRPDQSAADGNCAKKVFVRQSNSMISST